MSIVDSRLPTIPQYYKQYVDSKVDLNETPYQPCPFHKEQNGKSFSYSRDLQIWRCFGQCHCGGDVIDLHRLHYGLKSRDEAKINLYRMLKIPMDLAIVFEPEPIEVDEVDVRRRRVYNLALKLAKTPDDWLDLDYIMSKVPYDLKELETFCTSRGAVL